GAGVCQYDWAGAVPGRRPHHRRRRRRVQPRHAVARPLAAHDAAPRADAVDSEHLHADAGRPAVLRQGAGRPARGGAQLRNDRIDGFSLGLTAAVLFLAYSNGANDNFKGVATLFGSGISNYRIALAWATVTTLAGSLLALVLAHGLVARFQGKGLVPDAV